jgi:peptide/nickel transport system substrate-binding protein
VTLALRLGVLVLAAFATGAQARPGVPEHGIAMHGEPALPPGFDHPRYVNPSAPKGGRLTQGVLGTFDSLNPFVVKGLALSQIRGYVVESLLARGYDEPFTLYGLLARTVATDTERTYVTFALDPAAKFSDGKAVTAEDVIFSWQLLRDKGRPNYRTYYVKVAKAEALSERVVRFDLAGADDRELPLILGLMPVLPKHAVNPDTFEDTTFEPIVGSGPYVVAKVDAGRSISLKRDPNYWGRDLAINRGLWNFDEVRFDFYRDGNSHLEAFKKGLYDVRTETDPGRWETAYDVPAVRDGRIVKETFPYGLPKIFSGLVFNTRRPVFSDIRVREAIGMLLDFEWLNHNYFYDRYARSASYFEGSELSARGRPAEPRERALLAPFPDAVRADFMEGPGSRRHPTRPVATGIRSSARSRCSTRPATRSTARCCARVSHESRSASRSWSPPGIRSGWRSPSRATSSAPALRPAFVWSMPYNTTGGDSPTITT